jgi:hypothetical protein
MEREVMKKSKQNLYWYACILEDLWTILQDKNLMYKIYEPL